jgi:trimethylamine:corrinoid methyltransferase-like protein
MLTTQPLSGQNGPITPYGVALLAFSEFLAGMAIAYAVNPETKIVNGAYPTLCTAGKKPELKLGSVVHNFTNFLVAYTARLLDVASIQSGCTIEGSVHRNEVLETDYQTVRAMILWETLFEGWHMIRHSYGFLADLAVFSFPKARKDIAALRHIQSLDDSGITAVLANNVRLHSDFKRAEEIYRKPTILFDRENGAITGVILETVENFRGDFGKHEHTLKNIPNEWF